MKEKGIEYAIHGYRHIDYQQLSGQEQIEDFKKAIRIFNEHQVSFSGFRAPFLRFNSDTSRVLSSLDFLYDNSFSIYWDVLENTGFSESAWRDYLKVLKFYGARSSRQYLSLPRYIGQSRVIELPVSLPDDETLVEKLGVTDCARITSAWTTILEETHKRGELFTISLHPERINLCSDALIKVINRAREFQPEVWCTTLKEIARWWKEKQQFHFTIQAEGEGRYHIRANCTERATILVKNCLLSCDTYGFYRGYQVAAAREFILSSSVKPVIGLGLNTSPQAAHFLQDEGYAVDVSSHPQQFALFFNNLNSFKPEDEKRLVDLIECSEVPLVRFWRWPFQFASALTVTGDIDSITLLDFAFF